MTWRAWVETWMGQGWSYRSRSGLSDRRANFVLLQGSWGVWTTKKLHRTLCEGYFSDIIIIVFDVQLWQSYLWGDKRFLNMYRFFGSVYPSALHDKTKVWEAKQKGRAHFCLYSQRKWSKCVSIFLPVTFHLRGLKLGKLTLYHISPGHSLCLFFVSYACFISFYSTLKHWRDCLSYDPVTMARGSAQSHTVLLFVVSQRAKSHIHKIAHLKTQEGDYPLQSD